MPPTDGHSARNAAADGYAGGPATSAGTGFQHDVSAWLETLILAEQAAPPPWGLPASATLQAVAGETNHPVDDILVETTAGNAAVQAKTGLTLARPSRAQSGGRSSPRRQRESSFGSAIDQAVRAYREDIAGNSSNSSFPPYVFAAGPGSSLPITEHLRNVLDRLRGLPLGAALAHAAVNSEETAAFTAAYEHVSVAWQRHCGLPPTEQEVREVLSRIQVDGRAARDAGLYEREAKTLLRSVVLTDPGQADLAWDALVALARSLAANRLRADRASIRRELAGRGIVLQTVRSYQIDVERLRDQSTRVRARLAGYTYIQLGRATVRAARAVAPAVRAAACAGSLLIVGPPGGGKSGVLLTAAEELQMAGRDVLMLDAAALSAQSTGALRMELGLTHELADVLAHWDGDAPAFLLIDALDAARGESAAQTLRTLISDVQIQAPRWHVIVSVREYELRNNPDLKRLFPHIPADQTLSSSSAPGGLQQVRHAWVGDFDAHELDQIGARAPELDTLLESAPPPLAAILRNPFNLRLAAELLDAGTTATELRGVRLRIELLEKYWEARVISSPDHREADARESVLRSACTGMVERRRLVVDRAILTNNPSASRPLSDVLAGHVLREFTTSSTATPDRSVLTFSHHVLFDYAVGRLLLRGTSEALLTRLREEPDLVLMVRPSIVLHFEWLWIRDPGDIGHTVFWDTVLDTFRMSGLRATTQVIGPSVAATLAQTVGALSPLTSALHSSDASRRSAAEQVLQHLVGSLMTAPLPDASGVERGR